MNAAWSLRPGGFFYFRGNPAGFENNAKSRIIGLYIN